MIQGLFFFYVKGLIAFHSRRFAFAGRAASLPFQSPGVMKPAVDFSFMLAYRMQFS
ncbi:hypothetical protein SD78_3299 [Bacillus badius]|nr:hypothetical protein SD78_3299 [Bacillus badius]